MRNWTTSELADVYRKRGDKSPVTTACGSGRNKYGVSPKEERTCDGIVFASKAEMHHYKALKIAEYAGKIRELVLQPRFVLQDKAPGRREIAYVADFSFFTDDGNFVIVDVKGKETREFKLKRKLFQARYPHLELQIWK